MPASRLVIKTYASVNSESSNDRYRRSDAKNDFAESYNTITNLRSDFIAEKNSQANIERLQWEAIRELQDPR